MLEALNAATEASVIRMKPTTVSLRWRERGIVRWTGCLVT
jgi:hypothetical protein